MTDNELLKQIAGQFESANRIQVDSGFGLLVKDYAHYLETNPCEDAALFNRIYAEFSSKEIASCRPKKF